MYIELSKKLCYFVILLENKKIRSGVTSETDYHINPRVYIKLANLL